MNTLQNTNIMKLLACFVLAFSTLTLGGCARYPELTVKEAVPTNDSTITWMPPHDYLVGPGDNLNIIVWRNPGVSLSVPVRPDGKITTPLVEDLPASGKTSSQLARDIEKALTKYIQDPIVTVIVTGFVGPYSEQIRVIGQAAKPQALPFRDSMTLVDVLIEVGGLTPFADGNGASIIRNVGGKKQQFKVRLKNLINDGDMSANVPMRPGDVVVIPESFF